MLENGLQTVDLFEYERRKLLQDNRRQLIIASLAEQTPPVDCRELAEIIASREHSVDETDEKVVARVAVSLRYNHLPTLADWGVIEYDPETNLVEPRDGKSTQIGGGKWHF